MGDHALLETLKNEAQKWERSETRCAQTALLSDPFLTLIFQPK